MGTVEVANESQIDQFLEKNEKRAEHGWEDELEHCPSSLSEGKIGAAWLFRLLFCSSVVFLPNLGIVLSVGSEIWWCDSEIAIIACIWVTHYKFIL